MGLGTVKKDGRAGRGSEWMGSTCAGIRMGTHKGKKQAAADRSKSPIEIHAMQAGTVARHVHCTHKQRLCERAMEDKEGGLPQATVVRACDGGRGGRR